MLSTLVIAAEEAPNPLFPAYYDIIWSAVCFVIILVAFWKVIIPRLTTMPTPMAGPMAARP